MVEGSLVWYQDSIKHILDYGLMSLAYLCLQLITDSLHLTLTLIQLTIASKLMCGS
jgi:hypothetical protein